MKNKMLVLAAAGLLTIAGVAYGFATSSKSTCPLEGTPDCPKITCPLAGTADCPYDEKSALPACCKKK